MTEQEAKWVRVGEAARILDKSERTVRRWMTGGKIPVDRTKDTVLVDISGIDISKPDISEETPDVDTLLSDVDRLQSDTAQLMSDVDRLEVEKMVKQGRSLAGANLRGAKLIEADLTGAIMPDGSRHE